MVAASRTRVDRVLLFVVAELARRAALTEAPGGRRLIAQRAAREVEFDLLPAFDVAKQVVVEPEHDFLTVCRPVAERGVASLPPALDVVEEERLVLWYVEAVEVRPCAG